MTVYFDWDATQLPIVDEQLLRYNQTDTGNAEAFVHLFGDQFRFIKEKSQWVKYDGVRWRVAEEVVHKRFVQAVRSIRETAVRTLVDEAQEEILKKITRWTYESESNFRIKAAMAGAQHYLAESINDFDRNKFLLACDNEAIDLKTGHPIQNQPDNLLYRSTGIKWREEPEAFFGRYECTRWLKFLDEVFMGDSDLIRFIQKAVGYTLTGDTSEQCFFLLHGLGANGKSVFLTVLERLMGEYGMTATSSTFMEQKNEGIPNDIARMAGARFVKSIEVREMSQFNIEKMKSLTGGDRISARFLHAEYFDFNPVAKFWMAVNHKPEVNDPTYSFWRRTHEIPFNRTFSAKEQNKHLVDELLEELPSILNWAIVGCQLWLAEGLERPAAVQNATEEYMDEMDSIGHYLEEMTERSLVDMEKFSVLYNDYRDWCGKNGYQPVTIRTFGVSIKVRGIERKRIGTRRITYCAGIKISRRVTEQWTGDK